MERESRKRIVIAWILLLSMMPIVVVKGLHFHSDDAVMHLQHSASGDFSGGNSFDDCAICHFFLSPFVETTTSTIIFIFQIASVFICGRIAAVVYRSHSAQRLRGPPSHLIG